MAKQLTFDLPSEPALGRSDFFVSPSNANAVDTIQTWHDWPQGKLVLVGPAGSGKTHLAHVWAALTGAKIVPATELETASLDALAVAPIAIEDADRIAGVTTAERALFHLHNLALAQSKPILLTASTPPARWNIILPDLASRLQGTAIITLPPPDDTLLSAVMLKLFADRQLAIGPAVIDYLASRMERSFAGAGALVHALDQAALIEKRRITKALAAEVLDKMGRDTA